MNANLLKKKKPITRFCPTDGSLLGPNKLCTRCQKCNNRNNKRDCRNKHIEPDSKEAQELL